MIGQKTKGMCSVAELVGGLRIGRYGESILQRSNKPGPRDRQFTVSPVRMKRIEKEFHALAGAGSDLPMKRWFCFACQINRDSQVLGITEKMFILAA